MSRLDLTSPLNVCLEMSPSEEVTHATSALLPPIAAPKMLRAAARAAACSGAGVAVLSRRNMASSAGSTSVHSFSGTLLDGRPLQLATLAGRPALIVNVASE